MGLEADVALGRPIRLPRSCRARLRGWSAWCSPKSAGTS